MGGGSLMTPVMILVMGVKPIIAVGTDLAYGAVTKIIGGGTHWRQGTVHRKSAYLLGVGSVPATLLGVGLVSVIRRDHPSLVNVFLLHAIGWVLILVALVLVLKPALTEAIRRWGRQTNGDFRDGIQELGDRKPWILPIIGAVVGLLVGLTSVGSGHVDHRVTPVLVSPLGIERSGRNRRVSCIDPGQRREPGAVGCRQCQRAHDAFVVDRFRSGRAAGKQDGAWFPGAIPPH